MLDRIKSIETTIAEIRAHYKDVIAKDSSAVPGWWLQSGAIRRLITDPLEAYRRVSDTLSPEQFGTCVTVKISELERLWADEAGVTLATARRSFGDLLDGLIVEKESAPSLVRISRLEAR